MSSGALTRLLRIHVALASFPLPDVVEVRVALERLSARLAAERAGPEVRASLEGRLVAAREAAARGREAFNDSDAAFHVAIAEAAGNRLAADATIAIRESVRGPMLEQFRGLSDKEFAALAEDLNREHAQIVEAVAAGDGARADELVESHIRTAWARSAGEGQAAATMGA